MKTNLLTYSDSVRRNRRFSIRQHFFAAAVFCLGLLSPVLAEAVTVTIASIDGSTCPTCTSTSSLYTGIGTSTYTTANMIYTADEIGVSGMITTFGFQKTNGSATATLDSVYIFMREVSAVTSPTSLNLSGYTEVYRGDFTNTATSGWMSVNLITPFAYSKAGNLSVIVVRNRYAAAATMSYRSHYTYGTGRNISYRSNASSFWSSWLSPTSATTSTLTRVNYRPNVRMEIIDFSACSGTPTAGVPVASSTTPCAGERVTFKLSGASLSTGLTYEWDTSSTGTGGWALAATSTSVPGEWIFAPPAGRTLYYRCRLTCGAGGTTVTTPTLAVSAGAAIVPPYTEDFESVPAGVNPTCASHTGLWSHGDWWQTLDYSYDGRYLENHTSGGTNYLLAGYYLECGTGKQEYWFTPGIQLEAGKTYRFSYWYVNDGYAGYNPGTGAYMGTSPSVSDMSPIGSFLYTTNTSYKKYEADVIAPADGTYFFGIRIASTYNFGFAIDDIGLEELPDCNTATPATFTSAGKALATPSVVCSLPGDVSLSVSGKLPFSGLSYEWHRSSDPNFSAYTTVATDESAVNTISSSGVYYYRCMVSCASTGMFAFSDTVKVMTTPLTPPYKEDFESITPGVNVPCAAATNWSPYNDYFNTISGSVMTWGYTDLVNNTPGGSGFLLGGYGLTVYTGMKDFWFTPGIELTAGNTYEFSFSYLTDGTSWDPLELGAYIGTSQDDWAMTPIAPDFIPTNTTYEQFSATYTPTSTGTYYFGIYVRGNYSYGLAIDDIGVNELPPCSGKPASGGIASSLPSMLCSPGSVELMLSSIPKFAGFTYEWWECDASGSLIGSLSGPLSSPIYTTGTLSSSTYIRCVISCSYGAATDTTHSSIIKLDVGAIKPPYFENFETGKPGTNMPCASNTYYFGFSWAWNIMTMPYTSWAGASLNNHTPGGSKYLIAGSDMGLWSGAPYEYWFTPAIEFTAGKLYQLSYWYQTDGEPGCTYELGAFMGPSQDVSGMTTPIGSSFMTTTKVYQQFKEQFVAPVSGDFYIGIRKSQTSWGNGVAIDDIGLEEVPPCSSPVVAGTIVSDPSHVCAVGGSVNLDVIGSTLATGLTYQWLFSTTASGPYLPPAAGGTTLPYMTDPLSANTWFKLVVICTASGARDTSAAFKVGVGAYDLPYSEDFESTSRGEKPLCSDATYWGTYYYEGWYVCENGVIGGPYKSNTPGGKSFLIGGYYLGSPSSPSEDNYWFTPGLNLKAGYDYELSFYYLASYDSYYRAKMGVYYGRSQSAGAMTTPIISYKTIDNSSFERADTVFTVPADGVYYLGFRKSGADPVSTWAYEGVAFDDINVTYAKCNGMPFSGGIFSTNPSGTAYCEGTKLSLYNSGATTSNVPGIVYQWQHKSIGSSVWSAIPDVTDTVLSGENLVGYDYRFVVICTNTNDTAYSPVFSVPQIPPHPPVFVNPSTTPVVFCVGDSVKFNASSYTGAVYEWLRDSVAVFGWTFSDFAATDPGVYMVKVTSPLSPCPAYSNEVTLVANDPGYAVSITAPSDSIICAGTALTITASGSKSGLTYQWRKDNVDIPGATGTTLVISASGTYRVVAFDGASVCPAVSRNFKVTVKPNPPAVITVPGGTTTACERDGVRLNANPGAYTYEWYRSGSTVVGWTSGSQLIKNSGTYSVKVRTSDGCVNVSVPVTVNILPSPDPTITISGPTTAPILGTTMSYVSRQWIRNGADIPGAVAPTYGVVSHGLYRIRVTDANGCEGVSLPVEFDKYTYPTLKVDEAQINAQIRIYPNPTSAIVTIESPVEVDLEVKDVAGKTVMEQASARFVDLSKFADGVYLFVLKDKNGAMIQQRVTKTSK